MTAWCSWTTTSSRPATTRSADAPAERREDERRVAVRRRVEVALDERVDVALAPLVASEIELLREDRAHDVLERERARGALRLRSAASSVETAIACASTRLT